VPDIDRTHRPRSRRYAGAGVAVSFEAARCLHAAECVRGLPEVFDTARRPWISPDGAPPEVVAEVVRRCPSGALQYHLAAGAEEQPTRPTRVSRHADLVLHLRGDLQIRTPDGERRETRVMLCGCGRTGQEPFCDHSGPCAKHSRASDSRSADEE
jgi:uncharacterized Fe-S cluster protein YjdI/CDGSH-type Zn-finger protein